jgi:hypothetical protein
MSKRISDSPDNVRISLVYDSDFNLTDIREFSALGKVGEQIVNVTKLFYDSNFNLIRMIPNYKKDVILISDLP